MNRLAAIALGTIALGACATKGYVRQQVTTGVTAERDARTAADSQLTSADAGIRTDLNSVKTEVAGVKNDVAALRNDLGALRTEFGAKITAMEEGMKFAFPVTFAFDDATIRDQDRAALDAFTKVVNKYYNGSVITVEGHADPAGSPRYNADLSKRRAESVASYLTQAGMTGSDVRPIGYGETRQLVKGAEKDQPGAEANRRVVFVIESKGNIASVSSTTPQQP